ncbi:MAG: class I SAM-dependent methyltransferase [Pirellula sp.]|nr:class I SAM-dependent methyltransferase [Pirellula sp.]
MSVHDHNRRAWDALVAKKQRFTRPAQDEELHDPLGTVDGAGWLGGSVAGKRVLCLASGGGSQSILYAAAGAEVTVVDISPAQLALDREAAAERGLQVRTVEASMDDLQALREASFDVVIHPVSTCYLPEVRRVFQEVARVTVAGGLYISQHKTPQSLQAEQRPSGRGYELAEPYYRSGPLPPVVGSRLREEGTLEFLHRWEDLVGGICRAGFVIEDLLEPMHAKADAPPGAFGHRAMFVAPYVRIKARRSGSTTTGSSPTPTGSPIWMPE